MSVDLMTEKSALELLKLCNFIETHRFFYLNSVECHQVGLSMVFPRYSPMERLRCALKKMSTFTICEISDQQQTWLVDFSTDHFKQLFFIVST
jgi:hypothetical protein